MEKQDKTCSICLHDRKQPKLLTCLHVYCCQCLFDYVNKSLQNGQFPCPLCRVQIQLPSGGVEEFQDFSDLDDVSGSDDVEDTNTETDVVSTMVDVAAPASNVRLCDVCESQTIVKYRCKDCKQNICDVCKKSHGKIPVTKTHVIVDFVDGIKEEILEDSTLGNQNQQTNDTPLDLCSVHTSKPIEIHCVECKTCVCLQCYVDESNRGVHNGHRMLNLDNKDTQTKLRDDLKCLNTNLQAQIDRLQKFSDHLTSKLSEIDTCSEEACNKVDQQVQLISKLVQSRAEQIKTQINKTRHEERQKLEIVREEMEMSITELKSDIKDSLITLEGESVVKIVERNERNRNDEVKVKQKDLVVPNLQFPGFHPGSDVRDDVKKCIGECTNLKQQNFILKFNSKTISRGSFGSQNEFFDFVDLVWCVTAGIKDDGRLNVYLVLLKSRTEKQTKANVGYSFTIVNKVGSESRSCSVYTQEFSMWKTHGHGHRNVMNIKELKKPDNGFVDKDGHFSIRLTIQELKGNPK